MSDAFASPPEQTRNAPGQTSSQTSRQPPGQTSSEPAGRQQNAPGRPAWDSASANAQNWEPAQNAAIVPVASSGNDTSLEFDWQPLAIDTNRSCSCLIRAAEDHALSVRVEQPPYDRKLHGTGAVKVAAIPIASVGARGRLIAQDEISGATAEFTWEWKPIGKAKWANPAPPTARAGQKAAAPAVKAKTGSKAQIADTAVETEGETGATAKAALGPPASATFFGVPSLAQRFAFVLDMSGSMAGGRWNACVKQLAGALQGLTEGTEIFVVLFSDRLALPTKDVVWMSASAEYRAFVLDWVSRICPDGGTVPQPAFDLVFSLPARPDVIYFLTDGEFTSPSPSRLKKQCAGSSTGMLATLGHLILREQKSDGPPPTVINTITLDDASGAGMCRQIAKKSGGQYTHVSSSDTR